MTASTYEAAYKFCPQCCNQLERKLIDNQSLLSCSQCDFIFWNNPKPVVSIILEQDGKLLMLQRAKEPLKNYWCLPGGYINYEETPEEAVKRETEEEAGVSITIKDLVGVYRIDNDPRGITIDIIYYGTLDRVPHLSDEHQNFQFFNFDRLPENIAYKHREAVTDYLASKMKEQV